MKKIISNVLLALCVSGCGESNTKKPLPYPVPVLPVIEAPTYKGEYINFESGPVRPIAQLKEQGLLLVTNTSNNRIEVYKQVENGGLEFEGFINVGLEPVAVAVYNNKAWVVNHLSDSVSVINMQSKPWHVERTLLVGDEPRDIVFAQGKLFVSTAHRGQHRFSQQITAKEGVGARDLTQGGVGRADIWVFDSQNLGNELGGTPEKIVNLFGDTPRALTVSKDEQHVYAGILNSGNQTSTVHENVMCHGFEDDEYGGYPCQVMDKITSPNGLESGYLPGGRTAPGVNAFGEPQPWTSMIVKYNQNNGQWQDSAGRNFSNGVRFNLPDLDVFKIDVDSMAVQDSYAHVGTTLFNMAINPVNNALYVSNTEANNAVRFEGKGEFTGSTVRGKLAQSQISVIDLSTKSVKPRHLNRHIDYADIKNQKEAKAHSLSTPLQMQVDSKGKNIYLAAMGSNKVAVIPTHMMDSDSYWDNVGEEFTPSLESQNYIDVSGGPAGLLLDESNDALYVYTRFDNSIVHVSTNNNLEKQRIALYNSEPEFIVKGRPFMYDAQATSSNGESSCASCHIFSDTDHLSWNLGDPDNKNTRNSLPFPTENISELGCTLVGPQDESCQLLSIINGDGDKRTFASMKGPMMTQTLRGMQNHGHMHWRGDRSVGYFGVDTDNTLSEKVSFKNFIVAFEGLLGLDIELASSVSSNNKPAEIIKLEEDVDKLADFSLALALGPNPVRALDNSLTTSAQMGARFFHGQRRSDGLATDVDINGASVDGVNCEGCHGVDHAKGFYGTRGEVAHGGEINILKVPQLRNLYTRVGMYGLPDREGFLPSHTKEHQGDQVRGFGFLHDGGTDQLVNFLRGGVFDNGEQGCPHGADEKNGCVFNQGKVGIPSEEVREGLVDYLMEFDNDLAPVVGQQITLSKNSPEDAEARVNLFYERAKTPFVSKLLGGITTECELIATGMINDKQRGYFMKSSDGGFQSDKQADPQLSLSEIIELAKEQNNTLTFTCAVPGKGWRSSVDSNLNGVLNYDEV